MNKDSICKQRVRDKIKTNIEEYKQGKFVSIQQAIAVAYSQVSKKYPHCKRFLSLKNKKSRRRKSVKKSRKRKSPMKSRKRKSPMKSRRRKSPMKSRRNIDKVSIKPSTRKEKKYMAIFYNKNGDRIKTTHFGAKGYSDYTKHKDPERKKRYINRHKKRENWNDPTTAGALSRYILWGETTIRDSIKKYKNRFNLK